MVDPRGKKTYKTPYGEAPETILTSFRSGASDVMVVEAADLSSAIRRTACLIANAPEPRKDPRTGTAKNYWLWINLGCARTKPVAWTIQTVEVTKDTVRVSYNKVRVGSGTVSNGAPVLAPTVTQKIRYFMYFGAGPSPFSTG